jgi:hypothetical protein
MSDGSTRTINATNTTYTAAWTESFTNGTIVAGTGRFTAGSPTTSENSTINATHTDAVSGKSISASLNVTVLAVTTTTTTTTPAPTGVWSDAVYVGTVHAADSINETTLTKWLTTSDPKNAGKNYLYKVADNTGLIPEQTIGLDRDATVYDRMFVLYPQKYNTTVQTISDTGSWSLPNTLALTGTVTLTVNGSPMVFNYHKGSFTLTSGSATVYQKVRAI